MNLSVYSPPTILGETTAASCEQIVVNRPTVFGNDWSSDLTIALQTDAMNVLPEFGSWSDHRTR